MITIRKYRPEDKEAVKNICRVTAHSSYKKTPKTLEAAVILYNDYYTEQEPENIFVAANDNDEAVGYILCSTDEKKFLKETKTTYRKRLDGVCPSKNIEFVLARILTRLLPKKYRAHLHIDILPDYQKMGLGTLLMDAEREHLFSLGIPYLTVLSIDVGSNGYRFYKKYGFKSVRSWLPNVKTMSVATDKE